MRGRALLLVLLSIAAALVILSSGGTTGGGFSDSGWQPAGVGSPQVHSRPWALLTAAGQLAAGSRANAQAPGGQDGDRDAAEVSALLSSVVILADGRVRFEGTGRANQEVAVRIDGAGVARTMVDPEGRWKVITGALAAGERRVSVVDAGQAAGEKADDEVAVVIPADASAGEVTAFDRASATAGRAGEQEEVPSAATRARAERLAEAASREFDDYQRQSQEVKAERNAGEPASDGEDRDGPDRVAGGWGPIGDWVSKSTEDYYTHVVPELARRGGSAVPAAPLAPRKGVPPPVRPDQPDGSADGFDVAGAFRQVEDWLRDANRTYQETVVGDLSKRGETATDVAKGGDAGAQGAGNQQSAVVSPSDAPQAGAQNGGDAQEGDAQREAREREAADSRRLAEAEAERAAAEQAEQQRRLMELLEKRAADARQAEEDRRREELAEAGRLAEAERRRTEALEAESTRRAEEAERLRRRDAAEAELKAAEALRQREEQARQDAAALELARKAARADEIARLDVGSKGRTTAEQGRRSVRLVVPDPPERRAALPNVPGRTKAGGAARQANRGAIVPVRRPDPPRQAVAVVAPRPRPSSPPAGLGMRPVRAERAKAAKGQRSGRRYRGTGCKDRRAGRSIRPPGTYVVARGDTLWHIARRHYHRGERYRRIYRRNRRKIRHPDWIYPCQKFWLPRR